MDAKIEPKTLSVEATRTPRLLRRPLARRSRHSATCAASSRVSRTFSWISANRSAWPIEASASIAWLAAELLSASRPSASAPPGIGSSL